MRLRLRTQPLEQKKKGIESFDAFLISERILLVKGGSGNLVFAGRIRLDRSGDEALSHFVVAHKKMSDSDLLAHLGRLRRAFRLE